MVYESIRSFLGQQNFALVSTNIPNACILRNIVGIRGIFCVLLNNTKGSSLSTTQISSINAQILQADSGNNDVLFIIVTTNSERDRSLCQTDARVWLADCQSSSLLIYENQPVDFYGLRHGIEETISSAKETASIPFTTSGSSKNNIRTKKNNFFNAKFPLITIILIALNVIYYVILSAVGNTENSIFMAAMGANYGTYVFEDLQVWRLITSMFMHFGFSHLACNMVYLAIAGYNLEKSIGHWKFFLIYMLSGIGASVVSAAYYYLIGTNTLSAGASGAIYGIVGATCFLTFRELKSMKPAYAFYRIGIMLVFIFYSCFISSNVDGAAHIGGFVFGIILALVFLRTKRPVK